MRVNFGTRLVIPSAIGVMSCHAYVLIEGATHEKLRLCLDKEMSCEYLR